jgi:hypothetical protein
MDANEYERLSNITHGHKLKKRNSGFIAILHFTVTVGSLAMIKTHITYSLCLSINVASGHLLRLAKDSNID